MNELISTLEHSGSLATYLLIDMAVAIILLAGMRFTMGLIGRVDTNDELAIKDNFAYGISMAGGVTAMGIALSGAITGELAGSYTIEFIGMFSYGLMALILIKAGRYIHDKFALPDLDKEALILNRNISVSIVDAASVIATAIVVRASLIWVDGLDINTFIAIIMAWIVSQIMLILITRIFEWQFSRHNGITFQATLEGGQVALAIRYAGYLISTAMSVTAASYFIEFNMYNLWDGIIQWTVMSVILMISLTLLTTVAKFIVLWGINRRVEVEDQENIGIAIIELATSFAIALLLMSLMS
ncbi:ATP synthase F0, H+-transporting two-sector ATPase A subunit [Psychromonas sp. CNPT3]|uniref:DUF350 domain-containing protein n=1 Tax=Psychromonas sp. CNPT3 TaxID=314282 RepID=UPI00006E80D5|nr:DUF350 domain-containing protein [Psychromonas sp. CNPT3]AGH80780.1 ATP synthase F0, H+-transporting two-sector ATPase A subunit [Psychromonas sp. CNPT3]